MRYYNMNKKTIDRLAAFSTGGRWPREALINSLMIALDATLIQLTITAEALEKLGDAVAVPSYNQTANI